MHYLDKRGDTGIKVAIAIIASNYEMAACFKLGGAIGSHTGGVDRSVPSLSCSSLKATFPVGVPELVVTVAVKATSWPDTEGLADEVTAVEVTLLLTIADTAIGATITTAKHRTAAKTKILFFNVFSFCICSSCVLPHPTIPLDTHHLFSSHLRRMDTI